VLAGLNTRLDQCFGVACILHEDAALVILAFGGHVADALGGSLGQPGLDAGGQQGLEDRAVVGVDGRGLVRHRDCSRS